MSDITRRQAPRQGFTLGRAVAFAIALHVLFGGLLNWWPGLLFPTPASAATEPPPLQFTFVDTPETEPPEEPPDTATMSDIDRLAADDSPRDDQPLPFSEGNTAAQVIRPAVVPIETPAAEAQPPVPEAPPARPEERPEAAEPVADVPEAPEESDIEAAEPEATPAEDPAETLEDVAETVTIPPRRPSLRSQLTRLESFVDPQMYANADGGVQESEGLAQFDTHGYDLGAYLNQVLRRIKRHWRANMPPLIRTGIGGATFVSLSIRRHEGANGDEVATIVIERTWPSGQPAYDAGARFALELSNPLPPIPDYYPYEDINGRLGFIYNMGTEEVVFPEEQ